MTSPLPVGILVLDLDGTLYVDDALLPGAARTVARCREAGYELRFATNTTRISCRTMLRRLEEMGLPISPDEVLTAPLAAGRVLRERGVRRVLPLLPRDTWEDLGDLELVERDAEAVLVGDLGTEWAFNRLNRAFQELLGGAALYACQRNRFWRVGGEYVIDAGAFVAALEYAGGCVAQLIGKPSREFFLAAAGQESAAASTSPDVRRAATIVIGDDLDSDIAGAHAAGWRSVLVKTGKFRAEDLARTSVRPDWIVESVADVPSLLGIGDDHDHAAGAV